MEGCLDLQEKKGINEGDQCGIGLWASNFSKYVKLISAPNVLYSYTLLSPTNRLHIWVAYIESTFIWEEGVAIELSVLNKFSLRRRLGSASTFISSRFLLFFFLFLFLLPAFVDFGRQFLLLWTVYTLFTHCAYTVHVLKNIKNGSHDTIYTFKYYFATMFSVFNNNKFNPNTP